jgi:hypothetical protein
MGYTLINHDDPSIESFRGAFFKIRRALGSNSIGINEVRFPAGAEGPSTTSSTPGTRRSYGSSARSLLHDRRRGADRRPRGLSPHRRRFEAAGGGRPEGMTFIAIGAPAKAEYDGRESL